MRICLFLLVCFNCLSLVSAQNKMSFEQKLLLIEKEVEAVIKAENIPSVSIALVFNNNRVHYLNYGSFERGLNKPVTEESLYQIASLGKTFVGIVAHNFMLEGVISPDQEITEFLSSKLSQKSMKKLQGITIQELLHHRSGLPSDTKVGFKRRDGDPYIYNFTEGDLLNELEKARVRAGNNYRYSNFGYAVMAYILEEASGKSFDALFTKYISEPYGLQSTKLRLSQSEEEAVVMPYRKDKREIATQPWSMGKLGPPSAYYSSTEDLGKLLIAQMKVYQEFGKDKILDALMLTTNTTQKYEGVPVYYGYGFNSWDDVTFGHSGDMDGYASDYSFTPSKSYGIVLLTSSGEDWINPLIRKINRILGN